MTEAARPPGGEEPEPERRGGDAREGRAAAGWFAEPWLLAASLCLLAAAVCLWLTFYDGAFVAAALGAVAWFLDIRSKLPRREREEEAVEEEDEEPGEEGS